MGLEAATTAAAEVAAVPMLAGIPTDMSEDATLQHFTVLPADAYGDDCRYHPVEGDLLDQRIAHFSNSRASRVLLTRVDTDGVYLFGRIPIRCRLSDRYVYGVAVSLLTGSAGEERIELPLPVFVERWEAKEHSYFEGLLFPTGA